MKVVILCGGKGERLKEHTESIPKPLVEIGTKPILWHIMKLYSHHGFNEFILCLGYKGEKIIEYFTKNKQKAWKIGFVDTGQSTNTGGRIKKIEKFIEDDFMVTYGDGVSDINIKKLVEFHKKHEKVATVTCTNMRTNFGIIKIDNNNNRVIGFNEKPFIDAWINAGFFVFKKKIFNYLGENSVLEQEPMKNVARDNELVAYKYNGFWECMDTYKDTRMLNEAFERGDAKWMVWEKA